MGSKSFMIANRNMMLFLLISILNNSLSVVFFIVKEVTLTLKHSCVYLALFMKYKIQTHPCEILVYYPASSLPCGKIHELSRYIGDVA